MGNMTKRNGPYFRTWYSSEAEPPNWASYEPCGRATDGTVRLIAGRLYYASYISTHGFFRPRDMVQWWPVSKAGA